MKSLHDLGVLVAEGKAYSAFRRMLMRDLHLEIPTSILAAGLIVCLLSALGLFSPPTTQALYEIGAGIGLLGMIVGIIVFAWDK